MSSSTKRLSVRTFPPQNASPGSHKTHCRNETIKTSECMKKYMPIEDSHVHRSSRCNEIQSVQRVNQRSHSSCYVGERDYVYSNRHPDCTPPQMYLYENVRSLSTLNKQKNSPRRRVKSANYVQNVSLSMQLPDLVKDSDLLQHDDLTIGQKQYIWGMARCYSLKNLKKARQRAIDQLLHQEFQKLKDIKDIEERRKLKLSKQHEEYKTRLQQIKNGKNVVKRIPSKRKGRNTEGECTRISNKYYEDVSYDLLIHGTVGEHSTDTESESKWKMVDKSTNFRYEEDCCHENNDCKIKIIITSNGDALLKNQRDTDGILHGMDKGRQQSQDEETYHSEQSSSSQTIEDLFINDDLSSTFSDSFSLDDKDYNQF